MRHKDIYSKFMIEYDKANVLSSYPSLTEYEVATFLDKAYNALIAQKVTGNNVRRMGFETDVKAIEDLSPLIVQDQLKINDPQEDDLSEKSFHSDNMVYVDLPKDQLYFISAFLNKQMEIGERAPQDNVVVRSLPIQLVSHQMAKKFFNNSYNFPWIKSPIGYTEQNRLYIVYDPVETPMIHQWTNRCFVVYIKKPNEFVKDLSDTTKFPATSGVYTYFDSSEADPDNQYYEFECNDSVAEELISLAIVYALENIESARLNTKLNMRGLES